MAKLKELKDMVQQTIDQGARTVEEVHKAIASKPLEILERLAPDLTPAKQIDEFQQKTIGGVFEMIRAVNKAVGEIAESLLQKIDKTPK